MTSLLIKYDPKQRHLLVIFTPDAKNNMLNQFIDSLRRLERKKSLSVLLLSFGGLLMVGAIAMLSRRWAAEIRISFSILSEKEIFRSKSPNAAIGRVKRMWMYSA
ncbi:MAG: hypothetical protein M2R45_02936 [Verrucomicrobia subdivision 3 bacterium]|nr:hypothetical protein [Limisphaerales bacterium]MCS1415343.1 hypothetical protein [Limisphaerales bacterium]